MRDTTKIMIRAIFLVILMAIPIYYIVDACTAKINHGQVLEKWYEPQREYITFIPVRMGKSTILVPYHITDNEDWCIKILGMYKGKKDIESFYISKERYEKIQRGDKICIDGFCYDEDPNNKKVKK